MKSAQLFALSLAVVFVALVAPKTVSAAQLENVNDILNDSRPVTAATHTFSFVAAQTATIKGIKFTFCTHSSDAGGGCTKPPTMVTGAAVMGSLTNLGSDNSDWSLTAADGYIQITNSTGVSVSDGTQMGVPISTITNPQIGDCNAAGGASTDTCYVRILTNGTTSLETASDLDTGTASFTVIAAVTVSSRVDPVFTFTVNGVNQGVTTDGVLTTSVSSAYNTLPFGNLTAGTPKYAAHVLTVTTNTDTGYTVTMKMLTQMAGVYSGNNIDPYAGNSATWNDPKTWAEPGASTPNTNTGWIGANTDDAQLSQFDAQGEFGPVNNTANTVMTGSESENGSTPVYVTYALEANVFQPADTYTGTLVYNALPSY